MTEPTTAAAAFRAFAAAVDRVTAVAPRCARRVPHLAHVTGPDGSLLCWGVTGRGNDRG